MSYTTSSPSPSPNPLPEKLALHQNPAARQFVKFCIVGASSTVINFGVDNIQHYKLHAPLVPSLTVGFLLSCLNGFFWNRQWTFRTARGHSAATQSLRFIAVNIVGFLLNNTIVVLIIALYDSTKGADVGGHNLLSLFVALATSQHKQDIPKLVLNAALAVATAVVVFWNYFANRFWTFKHASES